MTSPVITVEHGVVGYDGRPVLRDISLTVTAGEVVAVLGANGSGKSTLIRAVLGLVPLSAGSVALFDRPLRRFRQWARIGYVPQRLGAGGGVPATVREVVASGRLARRGCSARRVEPTGPPWTPHCSRSGSPTGRATRCPRSPAASSSAP